MQKLHVIAINPATGIARAGASIRILNAGTATPSSIFSDDEVTPLTNPMTADASGRAAFKVADGEYDAEVSGAGFTTYTLTKLQAADKDNYSLTTHTHTLAQHTHQNGSQGGQLDAGLVFNAGKIPYLRSIVLRGHIYGLIVSNNAGDAVNDIDVAAGETASDDVTDSAREMIAVAALTKQLDATWAVGTNQGMRDTGAIADGTWHIFAIRRPDTGVTDILASLSPSAPTMPTNYTQKRRIRSILREAGSIVGEVQVGDDISRKSPVLDDDNTSNTTNAITHTLKTPTGIEVDVFGAYSGSAAASVNTYFSALSQTDLAPSGTVAPLGNNSPAANTPEFFGPVKTNTSAQIRSRSSTGSANFRISIHRYRDTRGRFS